MTGFQSPNYTQTPNDLFDELLPSLGLAELKVVLCVVRHTFGYHKDEAKLSIREIARFTGLTAKSVMDGAEQAEAHGLIERYQDGQKTTLWKAIVAVIPSNTRRDTKYHTSVLPATPQFPIKESKENKKETTANAVSKIVSSADKKMDAILAFERQGEQAKQNGYWHGQELFPPHLLPYANWWNSKTGQVMRVKPGAWLKEFTRWYDEELTTASLDEAFEHVKSWKKIVEKPADITSTAKAINDSPKPLETIPQREEGRSSGYYA